METILQPPQRSVSILLEHILVLYYYCMAYINTYSRLNVVSYSLQHSRFQGEVVHNFTVLVLFLLCLVYIPMLLNFVINCCGVRIRWYYKLEVKYLKVTERLDLNFNVLSLYELDYLTFNNCFVIVTTTPRRQ